jgi:hypothetical protein
LRAALKLHNFSSLEREEDTMLLTIKILLTIATLGYSAIPGIFDSNNTHATNPSWTGHARYHVVWQVSSYVYVAVLMLCLIWIPATDIRLLWIVAITAACMYAGFWTAYVSRPAYGGWLVDKVNGVPDFKWNLLGRRFSTDANVSLFTPAVVVLAAAAILLACVS